eukprot:5171605-Pyramimonas_sp.AAC.2
MLHLRLVLALALVLRRRFCDGRARSVGRSSERPSRPAKCLSPLTERVRTRERTETNGGTRAHMLDAIVAACAAANAEERVRRS